MAEPELLCICRQTSECSPLPGQPPTPAGLGSARNYLLNLSSGSCSLPLCWKGTSVSPLLPVTWLPSHHQPHPVSFTMWTSTTRASALLPGCPYCSLLCACAGYHIPSLAAGNPTCAVPQIRVRKGAIEPECGTGGGGRGGSPSLSLSQSWLVPQGICTCHVLPTA